MKRVVTAGGERIEYILIQSVCGDVRMQALPEGEIRVYAPKGMRLRDVDELVKGNAGGIRRAQRELDLRPDENLRERPDAVGSRICVEGKMRTLRLYKGQVHSEITEEEIKLWLDGSEGEGAVREALREALTERAQERIHARIGFYHPIIGGSFGTVTVQELGRKWGSCSWAHDLSFNWRLILAPAQALDYVVIHELCHLHEFSHSPRFWRLVKEQMPDYEIWKRWLKVHGAELNV